MIRELNPREATAQKVALETGKLKGVKGRVNIYRLTEWLGPVESTPNPFIWRAGITKPEDFFDRDSEQRTLRAYLRGRQNCQVDGPRRIGKTSLLMRVEHRAAEWEQSAVIAYLDLQDPRCFTLSGWLGFASRQFGWPATPASLTEFVEHAEKMHADGRHPVLCLDEFEQLMRRRDEFTPDFFFTLRACGQKGISIVTASRRPLSELTETSDPTSPFYNTFPLLRLGPFAREDEEDFANLRRPGVSPFKPDERAAILDFAKGHPLALQVACFHVLEAKQSGESLIITMRKAADDIGTHLPGAR